MESRYNDFNIKVIKNPNYPLLKTMKKSYDRKVKAEKEKEQKGECELLAIQTKGVNIVKEHILKRKREFLCHQKERTLLKQNKKKELEDNILHKYKINLQNIDTRNKIAHKLINYDKSEKMKINTQKQRMKFIVQKLLTEMESKNKDKEKKISPPKQKFIEQKKQDIIDDAIIDDEIEEIVQNEEEIEEWEDIEIKKPKDSKTIKLRKSKSNNSKKSLSSEIVKKSKPQINRNEYIMPKIPIINTRNKYINIDESKMVGLIPPCEAMNAYLDDLKDFLSEMESYPVDPQFSSKPLNLKFEDFENGKTYIQKLNIYNYSTDAAICSFERIVSDNEFCNVCLEVEDVGMQKIIPGKYFTLKVTFRPKDMQNLNGKLVFLTRRIHDTELKRFEVKITCEIATIKLVIEPMFIVFKSLPVWKLQSYDFRKHSKTIEVYNGMVYDCILVIRRKIDIPAMYDTISYRDSINDFRSSLSSIRKSRKSKKSKSSLRFRDEAANTIAMINMNIFIKSIIDSCLDYIDYLFLLDSYFAKIPAKSSINLKAYSKALPHVGCFNEYYEFEFISPSNNILLYENISLEIEVTGKFIIPERQYLDFNTCVYNFIYQDSVKIYNYGSSRIKIGFLFPSKLKKYFSIYPATFFMKPSSHEIVHIRFMPRSDLRFSKSKYFDKFTGILNFPMKICILAPRDLGVPPSFLTVYSIVTQSDQLNLRFRDKSNTYFTADNMPTLHLGNVTTHETVVAEIEIENLSAVVQDFGFLNLPEAIAIDPDYGFGTLNPNETKVLKLLYSPTIYDMITTDKIHTYEPVEVVYKISCTSVHKLGEIRDNQMPTSKAIQKNALSFHQLSIDQELTPFYEVETDDDLFEYHEYLFEQEELEQMYKNDGDGYDGDEILIKDDDYDDDVQDIQSTKNLTIIIKATIFDYWTEISHQNITFPDTPLGSYSTMKFQFSAINNTSAFVDCVCGFIKKTKLPNFNCHFEILGGADGITVEPICGDLKKNEHKQIYLIAKPSPDSNSVIDQAQFLKKMKKKSIIDQKERSLSNRSLNNKNSNDLNLYLAEKEVWKSIKPYNILANYAIVVNFTGDSRNKSNEIIYLTVNCRVIKPQFITSLNSQVINFGLVPVGTRPRQIFKIQNVSRHVIEPKIQLISPIGAFACSTQHKLQLEKEFILNVPITFSPTKEKVYNEYFEIKSENTIETVMVSGEGILPDYEVSPEFNVYRLVSKNNKPENCTINFENKSKAPVFINVVQTCELHGKIIPDPNKVIEEVKPSSDKPTKKEKKDGTKASSAKKGKLETMTLELTPDEEYSLANNFKIHDGLSPFKIIDGARIIEPFTKISIKIRFETPKIVEVREISPDTAKTKKTVKTKKEKTISVPLNKEYKYVGKYNIMMGNIVLIKDLIIIGQFQ